jgi:hypothetical protein
MWQAKERNNNNNNNDNNAEICITAEKKDECDDSLGF